MAKITNLTSLRGKKLTQAARERGVRRRRFESDRRLRIRVARTLGTRDLSEFLPRAGVSVGGLGVGFLIGSLLVLVAGNPSAAAGWAITGTILVMISIFRLRL